MKQMKYIFIAALVAAFATSAGASPFGPDGFDQLSTAVEGAREVPPDAHPAWLAEVLEHPINPESRIRDKRSTAFVQHEGELPGSGEQSAETSHQPLNRKE